MNAIKYEKFEIGSMLSAKLAFLQNIGSNRTITYVSMSAFYSNLMKSIGRKHPRVTELPSY